MDYILPSSNLASHSQRGEILRRGLWGTRKTRPTNWTTYPEMLSNTDHAAGVVELDFWAECPSEPCFQALPEEHQSAGRGAESSRARLSYRSKRSMRSTSIWTRRTTWSTEPSA